MEEKKQITNEMVAQALVSLPKTVAYRLGEGSVSYELRITAKDGKYEAYYYCCDLFGTQSFVYDTKGDNILKVIYELYEKVLQHGDLNQEVVNGTKCETCPHVDENCFKVHNVDNTTTCVNYVTE